MSGFGQNHLMNFTATAVKGFGRDQMANFDPDTISVIKPEQMANLAPDAVSGFGENHLLKIKPDSFATLNKEQVASFKPESTQGLLASAITKISPEAINGFGIDQIKIMSKSKVESAIIIEAVTDRTQEMLSTCISGGKVDASLCITDAKKTYTSNFDSPLAGLKVEQITEMDEDAKISIGDSVKTFENFDTGVKEELIKDKNILGGVGDFKDLLRIATSDDAISDIEGWDSERILEIKAIEENIQEGSGMFFSNQIISPESKKNREEIRQRGSDALKEMNQSFKSGNDQPTISDEEIQEMIEKIESDKLIVIPAIIDTAAGTLPAEATVAIVTN
jgi:hypothetical protein